MFSHFKSLRTRTLFYLLLLLFVFALASYLTTSRLLHKSLQQFEAAQAQAELERIRAVLATDAQALLSSGLDYSLWDDTYGYMQDLDPAYLASNFTAESLGNLRVDLVVFLDAGGHFHSGVDPHAGASVSQAAASGTRIDAIRAGYDALSPHLRDKGGYLFRWLGNAPALLVYSPIHDNSGRQPRRGWLVMARLLQGAADSALGSQAPIPFRLEPVDARRIPVASDEQASFTVTQILQDSQGSSDLRLIVEHPPSLLSQQRAGDLLLLTNSLLILVLAALAAALLLDRLILKRLSHFSNLAESRRHGEGPAAVWPVRGRDELDVLAHSLNELMAEVQTAHGHLYQEARKDPLTGLGNRKFLSERLQLYQALCNRDPEQSLVFYLIDLDDFKLINDCLGHAAGDAMLDAIALRLRSLVRASDTAVRMGGDEFAVLSLVRHGDLGVGAFAERLLEEISLPVFFNGTRLTITGSIGIAHAERNTPQEELLRHADIALYEAKRLGRSRQVIFSEDMHAQVQERMFLEQRLRHALTMGQLEVWFQPIIDSSNDQVVMVEALARWPDIDGFCSPEKFIPIAEEAGLIGELGLYIARNAIGSLPRLRKQLPGLAMNINLSVKQLLQADLVEQLCELVDSQGLPRQSIHFELTESAFADSLELLQNQVRSLVDAGFKLHLDDFGTGYSSLQRLQRLPMSALKLDKSFTHLIDDGDERLIKVILSLGEQLNMHVIAEGVESPQQRLRLQTLGCYLMQGHLFAASMPETQLLEWIQAREKHDETLAPVIALVGPHGAG
ncbi:putative bifunctional diguanylate cyclase/phosphodiesterase [Pseudomonas indica]|uniref:Diguanylate cyclase (GGDEF) domain-containing protein n=1 Tax=Pseudomonas indica TaxID=137658 RepID=A0A1G9CNU5_9PSED|nr:EAL domain-containing protein [Pseudomonas indica]SDK53342.1 diguanylate cyclase (GGDEF) domain-containing protein [Pseudomonas indica]